MTDKRNNLDQLFAKARTEPPVVTFGETRARVDAHATAGSGMVGKSNTTRNIIMITTGIGILAAALIGFFSLNSGDVHDDAGKANGLTRGEEVARTAEVVKKEGDRTLSLTGERDELGNRVYNESNKRINGREEGRKPNGDEGKEEKDSNGLFIASAPFISGIRMIELTREELGRLGLQPDTAGVWYFWNSNGTAAGYQITMWGTQVGMRADDVRAEGTAAPTFEPVFITDDFGNRRLEMLDDGVWQKRDDEIEAEVRKLEESMGRKLESEERLRLTDDIQARLSEQRLATGNFIPVPARTGHSYTDEDKANGRWRPDCIFWYRPTPEFLAALPERVRRPLERELWLASVLQGKPNHESMETFINRQPLEIRDAFDSLRSERGGSSVAAVAGDAMIGIFNAASGAITSSSVAPNPARDQAVLHYRLEAPRTVSPALYDVRGSLIRTFDKLTSQSAGEHFYPVDLKDVPPGMYLLVISTDKEKAIQRLIVE